MQLSAPSFLAIVPSNSYRLLQPINSGGKLNLIYNSANLRQCSNKLFLVQYFCYHQYCVPILKCVTPANNYCLVLLDNMPLKYRRNVLGWALLLI